MADCYTEQKKYSDAEALLNTIINNQVDENLKAEAQKKLDDLKAIQTQRLQRKIRTKKPITERMWNLKIQQIIKTCLMRCMTICRRKTKTKKKTKHRKFQNKLMRTKIKYLFPLEF